MTDHSYRRTPVRRLARRVAALGFILSAIVPGSVAAAGTTYHVDCSAGNDTASGTSTVTAWRTLSKANTAGLVPGDSLLLKRGCTWTGPLNARWVGTSASPITIGAYGSGALPKIQNGHENVKVTGAWMVIENIWTRSDVPSRDAGCLDQPQGWRVGFRFMAGSNNTIVRYSRADEQYIGILVESGAHHNKILNNSLRDNNMKDPDPNSDAGAVGISLMGDDNEIAQNDISGSDACSRQWVRDGAAIEVYGGSRNRIHHNVASQNHNFTELGKSSSADNTYAFNRVTSTLTTANFLVTRGSADSYGPIYRTKVYHNTVYLSGSQSYAIQCTGGCNADILTLKGNIVVAQDRVGYADKAFDEANNLYWRPGGSPKVYFPISSSSKKADPTFVNIGVGDLHLQTGSPAIDTGTAEAVSLGYVIDIDSTKVPQGAAPDMGAYEWMSSPTVGTTLTYVSDSFSRTSSSGWGAVSTGGSYRYIGPVGDFSVDGAQGMIRVAPGSTRAAALGAVLAADTTAIVRVRTDRLASGSGTYVYLVARQSADQRTEYRLKARMDAARAIYLQVTRVVNGVEASIGSEINSGASHAAGSYLWLRVSVTGKNPTTIKGRIWAGGETEPTTWKLQQSDSTTGLQGIGSPGLQAYVSGSAGATTVVSYDDWRVSTP